MLLLKLLKAHFKNHKILHKSSITLFETIVSLLILMVIVGGFLKIPYNTYEDEEIFNSLNELENSFATKDYRYFLKQDEFLTITKDEKNIIIAQYKQKSEAVYKKIIDEKNKFIETQNQQKIK